MEDTKPRFTLSFSSKTECRFRFSTNQTNHTDLYTFFKYRLKIGCLEIILYETRTVTIQ